MVPRLERTWLNRIQAATCLLSEIRIQSAGTLDLKLAHELIARTRVSRLLKAYRNVPAADENAVALLLVKLAQLAADLPEVRELDLNPILADKHGVVAVDARVAIAPVDAAAAGLRHPRFAIRPYPKEWERH